MKKRWGVVLTVVILILFIYVLRDIDFLEVYNLLISVNLFYFSIAFLFCLISFLLWNLRWKNSLKGVVDVSYWFLLKVLFAGIFMNTITPGTGVGGEPLRAYYLSRKYKKPKSKILGVIMADKLFNYSVFLVFLVFSILFAVFFIAINSQLKLFLEIALLLIFILLGILVFFVYKGLKINNLKFLRKIYKFRFIKKNFKSFIKFEEYTKKSLNNFINIFRKVLVDKRKFYLGVLISLGMWISNYLISYFLFLSFDARISFLSVIIVVTLGYLIGDISPVPGGIGLMESSMFLLYSAMGVPIALATTVSLLSRIIYYFYALILGGIALLYLRVKIK